MHVDPMGTADAIPFGSHAPPYVVLRVQPMAGELARYKVASSDPDEEPEEDIMQTTFIPDRVLQTSELDSFFSLPQTLISRLATVHQYGLFKFNTGNVSRPTTPTTSRLRPTKFALDVISRNIFGARPGTGVGDFFAGSMNGHRRSRTATADSRTSTLTSHGTAGSSIGRFSRTSGTSGTTAATSLNEDDSPPVSSGSFSKSTSTSRARSLSRGARKLVKRAKSPFGADVASEPESPARPKESGKKNAYARRRSMSTGQADALGAETDEDSDREATARGSVRARMRKMGPMDESERDLTMRLELARQNSQNQHGREISTPAMEAPSEETIYEGESSLQARTM